MSLLNRLLRTDPSAVAPLALRLGLGSVFIGHGGQKLFGWWGGYGFQATAQFFESKLNLAPGALHAALAGGGELFGGALIVLGLFTRFAAAQAAVIMGVAIWTAHRTAFFTDKGGMEFPLTLLLVAVALIFTGGGALSLDTRLAKSASSTLSKKS